MEKDDALDALLARLDADALDAARYRHVRKCPEMLLHLSNRDFDGAIDAALAAQPARMMTDKQVEGLINSKHFSLKYVRKASDEVCLNWYRLGVRDCEIAHGITLK